MSRPHHPKARFWVRLCVIVLYPLDGVLFRLRWRGLEKVPPPDAGGVIFVINHTSHVDTILMARVVWQSGRIPRFMIKAGLFDVPMIGRILRGADQIPVHRATANASQSLRDAVVALESGEAIVIYPEGTITRDPQQWPMQAKTGIARLALLCPDVPIVPVGQWGAQQPHGKRWRAFTRRTSTVVVGDPIDLSKWHGTEPTTPVLRAMTDTVMDSIRALVAEARNELPPPPQIEE